MNTEQARELFPHLKSDRIYFNHASTGPFSLKALEAIHKFSSEHSSDKIDNYKDFLKYLDETKRLLADYLNTTQDRIGFCDNTSTGLNILAQGINWKKGDRILLNDVEFPANVYPFLNLAQYGVEVDFVKSDNGIVSDEKIIENIKPETRLISVSYVQFLSGYKIKLEELGKICKEKDIILSVDAIQGLGGFQLDVKQNNIDFISCGTQKWMLGLQGLAFFYISKELQEKLNPKYVGWLSVKNSWDLLKYDLKLKPGADSLQTGTLNFLGIYILNSSLKIIKEFGYKNVEENIIKNSKYFISLLNEIGYSPILGNAREENLSGIVSFKSDNAQEIFEELINKKIDGAVREGIIRFSPHFYNIREEIDLVINVLKNISEKTK